MYYFSSGIEDANSKEFINHTCTRFYECLGCLGGNGEFGHYLYRFTEASFVNSFIEAIHKEFGFDRFEVVTELGVNKEENKYGRIDLIVTDIHNQCRYVIECKSLWSNQDEPQTTHWGEVATDTWYNNSLKQAQEYLKAEKFLQTLPIHLITLTFARCIFR